MFKSHTISASSRMGLVLALAAFAPGCSESRRQSIEGVVTLDGTPLVEGWVKLLPQAGTPGPTAGATIENGRFSIDASKGTFTGRFRVEILATRQDGPPVIDPETGAKVPSRVQYLPARYNSASELTAEITADHANRLEFRLTSK